MKGLLGALAQMGANGGGLKAKPVQGVSQGVLSMQLGVLDCSQLVRRLPGERDTREGGFRDALESMAMALLVRGVSLRDVNEAVEEVLDAYANDA